MGAVFSTYIIARCSMLYSFILIWGVRYRCWGGWDNWMGCIFVGGGV
jgi:hypothetical protein